MYTFWVRKGLLQVSCSTFVDKKMVTIHFTFEKLFFEFNKNIYKNLW